MRSSVNVRLVTGVEPRFSLRFVLLAALLATGVFWLFTVWTRYPFLADDYSYRFFFPLPDFDFVKFFGPGIARRPLMALVNYVTFRYGVLEITKLPYLFYYFLHSLGVIFIFDHCRGLFSHWSVGKEIDKKATFFVCVLICLYPGWFEVTLIAVCLPYLLGIFFLGLAVRAQAMALRTGFSFLAFLSFESYLVPGLMLFGLEAFQSRKGNGFSRRAWVPPIVAAVLYFLTILFLTQAFGAPKYNIGEGLHSLVGNFLLYQKLLWVQSFYKTNWVSTIIEVIGFSLLAYLLINKNRIWVSRLAGLILFVIASSAHSLAVNYYAPRALHGPMVIRSVALGLAILAGWVAVGQSRRRFAQVAIGLISLAHLSQFAYVVSNRSYNSAILARKEAEISEYLKTCQEPCSVSMAGIEDQMRWDFYMSPTFHGVFVEMIQRKLGIQKVVNVQ